MPADASLPNVATKPPAPAKLPTPPEPAAPVPPLAQLARPKRRHWFVVLSFLLMVGAPAGGAAWYLWTVAVDQYASTVAFSVRREDTTSAIDILGGLSDLSGSSSSDTDILYEFLQSQHLISDMEQSLDLKIKWSKPENDPVFAFDPEGTIEDLVDYWDNMIKIYYDAGAGLIEVRVLAFDPVDATVIAQTLFDKSADMINDLSAIAREDAIGYAREDLSLSIERLKQARRAITRFRNLHQLVDPTVDLQTQAGLLGILQAQLAEAMIEADLLIGTTRANDPRIRQTQRRIDVIQERIKAEKRKLGIGTQGEQGEAFADVVGAYEGLAVDREFAEIAYTAALATFDAAKAEARRKTRYLAAHIEPTQAQSSRFPERAELLALLTLFLLLFWATVVMITFSLKDRR